MADGGLGGVDGFNDGGEEGEGLDDDGVGQEDGGGAERDGVGDAAEEALAGHFADEDLC